MKLFTSVAASLLIASPLFAGGQMLNSESVVFTEKRAVFEKNKQNTKITSLKTIPAWKMEKYSPKKTYKDFEKNKKIKEKTTSKIKSSLKMNKTLLKKGSMQMTKPLKKTSELIKSKSLRKTPGFPLTKSLHFNKTFSMNKNNKE